MVDNYIHAKAIVSKLVRNGYIAYFAGGWVRDYVMGHPSEDIDIATSASPDQIMALFPQTILVGLAFGVVIVVVEGHQFEVATFRKDLQYIDGRHPEGIQLSTEIEDALRRDFTINGMFYDPLEDKIHDHVEGQKDIRHQIIRTIGDPHERFFEDRLRILRAFRFAARFEFAIDVETQTAIRENVLKLFPAVAMERVWQEFTKMSLYPRFDQALIEMHRLNVLEVIFPELCKMHQKELQKRVKNFSHFLPDTPTILFLSEILQSLSLEEQIEIAKRLKVSNKDLSLLEYMDSVIQAIEEEKRSGKVDKLRWAKLFTRSEWNKVIHILAFREDEGKDEGINFIKKYSDRFNELTIHIERLVNGKPLVSSSLLREHGIVPGKHMGALLKEAERLTVTENLNDPTMVMAKLMSLSIWHHEQKKDF